MKKLLAILVAIVCSAPLFAQSMKMVVKINGKIGYVRADLMEWDGMDTF